MTNCPLVSVLLENKYTGELSISPGRENGPFSLLWRLEADDLILKTGNFTILLQNGEKKSVPLSLEIPPMRPGSEPALRVIVENHAGERENFSFSLPVTALQMPSAPDPTMTEFRADAVSAHFSAGKLTGQAGASGLQELKGNGLSFFRRPPRFHGLPLAWKQEELCFLKVIPDRFDADGSTAHSHALVLPRGNEEDELEVTQSFTPRADETIVLDCSFIVPASFAPLGELGVEMEMAGIFEEVAACQGNEKEISLKTGDISHGISFLSCREKGNGAGLLFVPTSTMGVRLSPGENGGIRLFCGMDAAFPLNRGCYRLQLFLCGLPAGENAASTAHSVRLFHRAEK